MTAAVSVVIPWRDDHGHRRRVWDRLVAPWWQARHPDWQLVVGVHEGPGPWCKAAAVADGLNRADGTVLVLADADVLPVGVGDLAGLVASGATPWGQPHRRVVRLTAYGTARYAATGELPIRDIPPPPRTPPSGLELVEENHRATIGGGCVVLTRNLYDLTPLDPRFLGWGAEDSSWGKALTVVAGPPWRPGEHLWHLWHPAQARLSRSVGSVEGDALWRRYQTCTTPEAMLALIAEGQASTATA